MILRFDVQFAAPDNSRFFQEATIEDPFTIELYDVNFLSLSIANTPVNSTATGLEAVRDFRLFGEGPQSRPMRLFDQGEVLWHSTIEFSSLVPGAGQRSKSTLQHESQQEYERTARAQYEAIGMPFPLD